MLFPGLGRSVSRKTLPSVLNARPSPKRLGPAIQDLGQSFSRYGPPAREITYIYFLVVSVSQVHGKEKQYIGQAPLVTRV